MFEFIYVVKRRDIKHLLSEFAFEHIGEKELEPVLNKGFFIERRHAEYDSDFKQIIPYVIFYKTDNSGNPSEIFCFKRLKGSGEKRLHDLYSVGIGGHINPEEAEPDIKAWDLVKSAAKREISEETDYAKNPDLHYWGMINDDRDDVGRVHTGLVFGCKIPSDEAVNIRETEVLKGEFMPFDKVIALPGTHKVESWTKAVLTYNKLTDLF